MALSNYTPRYNVDDYAQWEGDWELWSGVPIAMTPSPGFEHQLVSGVLIGKLREALNQADCRDCLAVQDLDWRVDSETVLRPDLVVLCERPKGRFITETPSMVIEVLSDSTRQRDLLYKREMYEKLNVPAYLIVDPKHRSVTLLKKQGDAFTSVDSQTVRVSESCEISLNLADLFAEL